MPDPIPDGFQDPPAGHCSDRDAWVTFALRYYPMERRQLTMGDMTDFELANAQFMASRNDLNLIAFQTAAKDRIRWLSLQLAGARAEVARLRARG